MAGCSPCVVFMIMLSMAHKMAHVKNLSRDPHEALQKPVTILFLRAAIQMDFASDVPVLTDFDPNKVSDLNTGVNVTKASARFEIDCKR